MKKIFIGIALVLVVLVGGFFVAINMIKPETVQQEIAKLVQDMTGQPLYVKQVPSISFMPLGVKFGQVSWGHKEKHNMSFAANSGLVQVQFLPLLSGRVVIDELHLDSPVVHVVIPKATKKESGEKSATPQELPLELALLEIKNGQFSIEVSSDQIIKINDFNATLTNLKPGTPSALKLKTLLDVSNPSLKGSLAFDTSLSYAAGTVTLQNTKLLYTPQAGLIPAGMGAIDVSSKELIIAMGDILGIKGQVSVKELKLDALMAQSSAPANTKKSQKSTAKTIYPQLDLAVNVGQVLFKGLTIKDIQTHAKGKGGASTSYDFNPIKLSLASGGSVNAKSSVQLPSMKLQKEGTLTGLKLGPILTALQGQSPLDAVVNSNWNLSMTASSSQQIMKTLSGNGKLQAKNIVLKDGVSIPNNPIVKPASFKQFAELSVPFVAKNGNINISNAALVGEGVSAKAAGNAVLPSQKLDLKIDASALGMVIPLTVSGTFSDPSYGIDPKWITNSLVNIPSALVKGGAGATESVVKGAGDVIKGAGDSTKKVTEGAGKLIKGLFGN